MEPLRCPPERTRVGRYLPRGERPRDFPGFDVAVGDLLAGREHWHRYCWPGPWIAADHDSVLLHLQERTVLP